MVQKKHFKTILIALVIVGGFVAFGYGASIALNPPHPAPVLAAVGVDTPMVPANFSDLAEKVRPGVVNIQVVKKVKNVGMGIPHFRGNPFGEESLRGLFRAFLRGQTSRGIQTAGSWLRVCHEPGRVYPHQ